MLLIVIWHQKQHYFRTTSGSIITNFDGTVTTIDNTIYRITNGITNIIISSINTISNSNGRIILLSIVQYYQSHKQQYFVYYANNINNTTVGRTI